MAKVKLNPVLEKMRGKIGDLVFRRYEDTVVVAQAPDTAGRAATPGQAAHRQRFRLAVHYGKSVLADPANAAAYQAAAESRHTPAFALAVGDFLNPPQVAEIDLSAYTGKPGEAIRVSASDDLEVTGVSVAIKDTGGAVLEQGTATHNSDGAWVYTSTTTLPAGHTVTIEATATDRPGHKGTMSKTRS